MSAGTCYLQNVMDPLPSFQLCQFFLQERYGKSEEQTKLQVFSRCFLPPIESVIEIRTNSKIYWYVTGIQTHVQVYVQVRLPYCKISELKQIKLISKVLDPLRVSVIFSYKLPHL